MKNLTEFPGFLLRRANAIRAAALDELRTAAPPQAHTDDVPRHPEQAGNISATTGDLPEGNPDLNRAVLAKNVDLEVAAPIEEQAEQTHSQEPESGTPPADGAAAPIAVEVDSSPKSPEFDEEALATSVGEALKISGERLTYLMGALNAVNGKGMDKVRQVRVFKGEEAPTGAFSIGDLHFVVDRVATAAKKNGGGRGNKNRGSGGSKSRSGGNASRPQGGRGFDSMARDEKPGTVPSGGLGWSLERAPGAPKKDGRGRGAPGRKGPRRPKSGANSPGDNHSRGRGNRSGGAKSAMPEVVVKATTVPPSGRK